jgi:hypothetical protein
MRLNLMGAFLFLVVIVPGLDAADEKPTRHVEKFGGFSYVPPAGWQITDVSGFKYKIAIGPEVGGFAPNIYFLDESFRAKLADYVTATKKALSAGFKDFKELSQTTLKRDDRVPCIRLIVQRDEKGKVVRQWYYFLEVAPGKKLTVTCTAPAASGEKFDAIYEATMKTFRTEKP